ncbi:hypothetical protein [Kaistia sp. MMO-174]|uniref:hypothetical protein n=1 Tax=Kaistia sp. MMO-174 TaxID=3081256 RepID=UPI00301B6694
MTKRAISVTDHAVLRFMERVHDLDIDAIRQRIAERVERSVELATSLDGEGTVTVVKDGFRYVVKGGTVVTITRTRDQ